MSMVEEMDFKTVKKIGDLEIRRYGTTVLATVSGISDNTSFRILFDYIQGSNTKRESISMTAPVISSEKIPMTAPVVSGAGTFSFVLPARYSLRSAPRPGDPSIELESVGPRVLGVIRFSGRATEKRVRKYFGKLLSMVRQNGLRMRGAPFLMRYNSPFMPGPFRRNEAAVELVGVK